MKEKSISSFEQLKYNVLNYWATVEIKYIFYENDNVMAQETQQNM